MKFKEVYCDSIEQTLTLDEITEIYKNNYSLYAQKYKFSFWCPECKKAKLAYNNAATPYFSSYPNSSHADSCAYRQDELLPEEVDLLVSNKKNYDQIARQMDSLMHTLFGAEKPDKKTTSSSDKPSMSSEPSTKNDKKVSRRISRKCIDATFHDEDFNTYKLFYGDLKLVWERAKNNKDYKIILYALESNKFVCKIDVPFYVYPYIPNKFKSTSSYNCKIVLFASIQKHKNNYKQTTLKDSRFLQIHHL